MSTLLLIHELPRILREKRLMESAKAGIAAAQHVIFPAGSVCKKVIECLNIQDSDQFLIRPQGTYKTINVAPKKAAALRSERKIPEDAFVVVGAGYADMRKGFDLFLQVWRILTSESSKFHFVWVGGIDPALRDWLADEIADAEKAGTFHMAGYRSDMDGCFTAASAFALTSREDPFPAVVLEAMSIGVPVIAFADSGGIPEFLTETGAGQVVPYCDAPAMAHAFKQMAATGTSSDERLAAARTIKGQFGMTPYVRDLVKLMLPDLPSVSIVVPNYNYAHCLTERLLSIFEQTHPVEEVVVLDDASTDQSVSVVKDVAKAKNRDVTIIANSTNSGSVFKQWSKAADIAQGDFIWIAEADDVADPGFLTQLLSLMRDDPTIQFAFCDSKSIDADGAPVYPTYKPYYETLEPLALTQTQVFGGEEFVTRFLSVKNVILNVSSVVWRREALVRALAACRSELSQYKMAGDWRLYVQSLMSPDAKIAYVTDPLNVHRRHSKSVTHSLDARQHLNEIARVHKAVRRDFQLSPEKRLAQAKYLAELSEQLHVDPLPLRADGPPEQMLRSAQF
jgi:glycosyltransferase involved in cell wall biosynthesis